MVRYPRPRAVARSISTPLSIPSIKSISSIQSRSTLRLAALAACLLCIFAAPARAIEGPAFGSVAIPAEGEGRLEFNRHVRPILSEKCFFCHGPDTANLMAGLRLDRFEDATADRHGVRAIVPGAPEASELAARIQSTNPNVVMPPPDSQRSLSAREQAILVRWIREGAEYEPHWAFVPPTRRAAPAVQDTAWPKGPVDGFVLARQERHGLAPAPEADRVTLARRLHFDLTGLPPTPEVVAAFTADTRPDAYERLVDSLLASPHFGERMAVHWLDLVRYADTNGYHSDEFREMWAYRDYVIRAFNGNKPFDQFTREQLAGDLLPDADRETLVASGYNRLNQITAEGGAQPKEYEAIYAADRVRTTGSVWLGLTMNCAQCHDHKYDPITAKDFYRFSAFFADIEERSVYGGGGPWVPVLPLPSEDQEARLARLDRTLAELRADYDAETPERAVAQAAWEESLRARLETDTEGMPEGVVAAVRKPQAERGPEEAALVAAHFRETAEELKSTRGKIRKIERAREKLVAEIPTTMITRALPEPRVVRLLNRGDWMDETGEIMAPGVPEVLPQIRAEGRASRLDLAEWILAEENPLTARVFVNRLWAMFLGVGLSKVLDDLGGQGEPPSHPDLLDWLAVEFRESGWDVKHMVRLVVTSAAYRQSATAPAEVVERDPYNRLLARQTPSRLPAEFVRDNALAIAGLLTPTIGGRSVFPYQPDGYWDNCNTFRGPLIYTTDTGDQQYRRGLYTIWKRSFLHPSMLAFDAPTREECVAERPASNTPLQALVLLNDPTYVEAARVFAERIHREGGSAVSDRLQWAARRALSRDLNARETATLAALLHRHYVDYAENPAAAGELLAVGQWPVPDDIPHVELAAWTSVARALLNLHETITRS